MTVFKLGLHWVRAIFIAEEGKQRCIYSGRALACLGWVLLGLVSVPVIYLKRLLALTNSV